MTESNFSAVRKDLVVTLDYVLTVEGEEVDNGPIEYLQGHNNIIPGLEKEIEGMALGETKSVKVSASEAYGELDPDAIVNLPLDSFPKDYALELGEPLHLSDDQGRTFTGYIEAISADHVEVNLNHPLAGKELLFTATVSGLRAATEDELAAGHLHTSGCGGCHAEDDDMDCGSGGCGSGGCGSGCCGG